MKIVLISNFFNHHQKPVSDAFYKATKGEYWFVETTIITPWRKKMGYKEIAAPYTVKISDENRAEVIAIINDADVVITDAEFLDLTKERYEAGKLIFRYSERLFKSRLRYLKAPVHTLKAWRTRKMYMLCSSAFTSRDYHLLGFYQNKTYKWGYFPVRSVTNNIADVIEHKKNNSILWVGRMIDWKHPESVIFVAEHLLKDGYDFDINIIGWGEMEVQMKTEVQNKGLIDKVHFLGSMSPSEVQGHMAGSAIFLFTSDEGEGWGAVLNEAMNNGCAVVASDKIGSVPFLLKNGENGFEFKSKDWDDLYLKVRLLFDDSNRRKAVALRAYETIDKTWNEEQAVENFIALSQALIEGKKSNIFEGPCSPA